MLYKFLDPSGCSSGQGNPFPYPLRQGNPFPYPLPTPDQTWGPWIEVPTTEEDANGEPCGNGLHLMKSLNAIYAPLNWWPWAAQGEGMLGEDDKKARFRRVRLRRILPPVFHRMLRLGMGKGADLVKVHLEGTDLRGADLKGANLWGSHLRGANLGEANLREANLGEANLEGVNLEWANLEGANLWEAHLGEADLRGADLEGADLGGANLRGADLERAYLRGADLKRANLEGVAYDTQTIWPTGFDLARTRHE